MSDEQDRATTEVRAADNSREDVRQAPPNGSLVAYKIIWLVAGVIIGLLALRMVFLLLAANQAAPFVDFIYGLSSIFAAPFYGIFSYTPAYGQSIFEVSSLVAIIVYALIAWGLGKLVTVTNRRTDI